MDIQRPSNAHAKKIRRIIYVVVAVVSRGAEGCVGGRCLPIRPYRDFP